MDEANRQTLEEILILLKAEETFSDEYVHTSDEESETDEYTEDDFQTTVKNDTVDNSDIKVKAEKKENVVPESKNTTSGSEIDAKKEERNNNAVAKIKCTVCGKCFHTDVELKEHMNESHSIDGNENLIESGTSSKLKLVKEATRKYTCNICNKIFPRRFALSKHRQKCKTRDRTKYECEVCERIVYGKEQFRNHEMSHTDSVDEKKRKLFSCKVCNKLFVAEINLKLHMEVHDGTQKFSCTICQASFSRSSDLKRHMCSHTGEKPYKCSLCPKAFTQPGEFGRHKALHRGKNTCKYCGKQLVRDLEFRKHVLKHELKTNITDGMAKLQCKVCGDILSSAFNLDNHMISAHSVTADTDVTNKEPIQKTYPCLQCDLVFTTASNRARHVKSIHTKKQNDKSYKCDICGKDFSCMRNLSEHVTRTHMKIGLCKCETCDRLFYKKIDLKRHKERHCKGAAKDTL